MELHFGYRGGNTARILLAAVAMLMVSAPVSVGQTAEEKAARCSNMLRNNYGAVEFNGLSVHRKNKNRSVYATVGLADGRTARVRCLFRHGRVFTVQVYSQGAPRAVPFSSDLPGNWRSADSYRTRPRLDAADLAEPTRKPERIQPAKPHRIQVD
jgi:hypothetical protein